MGEMRKPEITAGAAFVAACWLLALASAWTGQADGVCIQDRVVLKPVYMVDLTLADGTRVSLCNVTCALLFLRDQGRSAQEVSVRDETTGEPIDSETAFYVESEVFTHRESANRIHVFALEADARRHAGHYGGTLLPSPFTPHIR
jgi:hypothetical protein